MKQADLGLNLTTKRTRKREFFDEMNRVVPWSALVELVASHAPVAILEYVKRRRIAVPAAPASTAAAAAVQ